MAEKVYRALAFAQQDRDAALRRVARVRGMTIAGAGALTAALAGVVSAVAPGRTLGAKPTAPASIATVKRRQTSSTARMPPLASAGQLGLQAPGSAPQSAPGPQTTPAPQAQPTVPAPAPAPVAPSSGVVSGGS
jgi:hypothetical protein